LHNPSISESKDDEGKFKLQLNQEVRDMEKKALEQSNSMVVVSEGHIEDRSAKKSQHSKSKTEA
jgi:hypothetical protein